MRVISRSLVFAAAFHLVGCAVHAAPNGPTVFTSTREVRSITATNGSLWAATAGGILRRLPDGTWRKYTRLDGLPGNEATRITVEGSRVTALFRTGQAQFSEDAWKPIASGPPETGPVSEAVWRGKRYVSEGGKFGVFEAGRLRDVPLPTSAGSHVSALLARPDALWAALFGDGLWTYDGSRWQPAKPALPPEARQVTALAHDGRSLWVGTRRAGLWECDGSTWKQHLQPNEPPDHNAQSMIRFKDRTVIGTLEDGLAVREGDLWTQLMPPAISSNAPRQMVEFQGKLYVRHGNGKVDSWDGDRWERDVCSTLKRRQVSNLATDGRKLFVGLWGGWSEFDGKVWEDHLRVSELQGIPTTALATDGERLWIGTQGHGLAAYDPKRNAFEWQSAVRLLDDWVTCMLGQRGRVYVGTFVGGYALRDGSGWETAMDGENITDFTPDGSGGVYAGTRKGLWRLAPAKSPQRVECPDGEVQSVLKTETGLWVGTRTGIYLLALP